jgi:probable HAF family extracellular repeat protein
VRRLTLCAAAIVAGLVDAQAQSPAERAILSYEVIALPLRPAAINDSGEIAGTTPEHRAALWSRNAGLRLIDLPAGFSHAEAVAIDREGQVAGIAYDASFKTHQSFLASSRVITLLGSDEARVHALGPGNRAVGESRSKPVVWNGGNMRRLESCCGGSAQAANDRGQVAGTAYDTQGHYHSVLWDPGARMREIGPDGVYSATVAMNNRGDVLIQALSRVYLFSASGLMPLDLPRKPPAHARAVNDEGIVVGYLGPFSDAARAFLWSPGSGIVDLNSRLRPNSDGWKLELATGINNRGEIVGKGDTAHADDVGFLLLPVP